MIDDRNLDKVSAMCDLVSVVKDAAIEGLISRPEAGEHVRMYLDEVSSILNPNTVKGEEGDGPKSSE